MSGFLIAFTFVFCLSFATFWLIKKTYGLRVSEAEEDAGLDISEHGMYGYPEQFIPQPEYPGGPPHASAPGAGRRCTRHGDHDGGRQPDAGVRRRSR